MKAHITKVDIDLQRKCWRWDCQCGKSGTDYPTRQRALNSAQLHRAKENLR